ncbi:2-oxoacid:acceptor oxidoreductase subunit alpha [Halovenus sp. WSH3]|uniref:2-oxoglutarate synthase subunit KorA n=1 Tax=Halovenus carboxidivorans TaxID=2692199 RepID=A0A6B0SZL9_9EURY|nr:2-oxoacid:acceptor oxidoreductase subunit alpha [Halovenus carboxidivorans]MXR51134.1 2-oxoacid:acceptor oxidoreductase subunit alpha [Halovenus carboxidivorans]
MTDTLMWRIAGGSGDGIDSTSQNFAKALMRAGLHIFTHRHYPSRIRGGHTYVEVRAGEQPVRSRGDGFNFLLSLGDSFARNPSEDAYYGNEELKPLTEHLDELNEGGVIVYDTGLIDEEEVAQIGLEERAEENNWHVYPVDLRELAREHGREVMRNTAGIGITAALLDIDTTYFEGLITEAMSGETQEQNLEILQKAYDRGKEFDITHDLRVPEGEHDREMALLSGSNAIAYGALDEGCRFISGYPMTPWTDVFTIMSQNLPHFGGISEQVEDEIAAAALALGASHAGAKAMSGSSGGGFALMSEPLGLAEMTETPVVLVEAMRAGPSTGMPTKPEQADLEHVLYTSQGDSCRVVFAPANVREAYDQTRKAFELAYSYNLPAIVIYDQKIQGELRTVPVDFFDREPTSGMEGVLSEEELAEAAHDASGNFMRYRHDVEDGSNPRSIPGQKGGRHLVTGNESQEVGHISESPDNRKAQMDRRMRKLSSIREELDEMDATHQSYHGPSDAEHGILVWGSQQDTVFEAVDRLNARGESVKALGVSDLMPYPETEVTAFLESVEECLVVEMNASGQFRGLTQRELGRFGPKMTSLLKYDGEPFEPGEIVDGFESSLSGGAELSGNVRLEPAAGD